MISVLVVDDEPGFLDIAERFLVKDGDIRVFKARSVKAAFEWLRREHVDVIISDYEMPEINGIEFLIELRKNGSTIPFMILTGKGWVHVATKAMDYGVDHYLRKGEDPRELFEHIRRKIRYIVQERAQRKLYDEQFRRYRNFFEMIPLACVLLNDSNQVIEANKSACTLLGYNLNEVHDMNCSGIFLTDTSGNIIVSEQVPDAPLVFIGQQLPRIKTFTIVKKDGTRMKAEVIAMSSIPGENQVNIIFRETP